MYPLIALQLDAIGAALAMALFFPLFKGLLTILLMRHVNESTGYFARPTSILYAFHPFASSGKIIRHATMNAIARSVHWNLIPGSALQIV